MGTLSGWHNLMILSSGGGKVLAGGSIDSVERYDVLSCSHTIERDIKRMLTSKDLPIITCGGFNICFTFACCKEKDQPTAPGFND
ncbi:hypothetical protein YC2023_049323 [Brassica napus]